MALVWFWLGRYRRDLEAALMCTSGDAGVAGGAGGAAPTGGGGGGGVGVVLGLARCHTAPPVLASGVSSGVGLGGVSGGWVPTGAGLGSGLPGAAAVAAAAAGGPPLSSGQVDALCCSIAQRAGRRGDGGGPGWGSFSSCDLSA